MSQISPPPGLSMPYASAPVLGSQPSSALSSGLEHPTNQPGPQSIRFDFSSKDQLILPAKTEADGALSLDDPWERLSEIYSDTHQFSSTRAVTPLEFDEEASDALLAGLSSENKRYRTSSDTSTGVSSSFSSASADQASTASTVPNKIGSSAAERAAAVERFLAANPKHTHSEAIAILRRSNPETTPAERPPSQTLRQPKKPQTPEPARQDALSRASDSHSARKPKEPSKAEKQLAETKAEVLRDAFATNPVLTYNQIAEQYGIPYEQVMHWVIQAEQEKQQQANLLAQARLASSTTAPFGTPETTPEPAGNIRRSERLLSKKQIQSAFSFHHQ